MAGDGIGVEGINFAQADLTGPCHPNQSFVRVARDPIRRAPDDC
jgi:hypothetical protein